jgi:hypothetical protein
MPAKLVWLALLFSGSIHGVRSSTIVVWGNTTFTNPPPDLTNAVTISAGASHNLALRADGTVVSWGGQTNVPPGLSNVVAISTGANANLALKENGTLVSWGTSSYGQTNIPLAATNIVAISVGSSHCLALRHDGSVVAWGANNFGQTNIPLAATNIATISAGGAHSAVLRRDGDVLCWGRNDFGQVSGIPANLSDVAMVSAGGEHTLALHRDGSHSYWGVVINYPGPIYSNAPTGLTNIAQVSCGSMHTTSLLLDGIVRTDGYPPTTNQPSWLSNVVAAPAGRGVAIFFGSFMHFQGGAHSLALVGDGAITSRTSPSQPMLKAGDFLILSPFATGPQPLQYQWRLNDTNLPAATEPQYVIPRASRRNAGDYSVIISNASQSITCQVAHVSVSVRQKLEADGVDAEGRFVLWSGDEDGAELSTTDVGRFTLEAGSDGLNWTPQTNTPSLINGLLRYIDADTMGVPNRFYRVREAP